MRLDPNVRRQVEAKLKRSLPEPDEPEFYQLLEELRVQDPETAALLEEGIQFEQVKPPEEEVKQEVKKRALLRDLANRLFRRYDELTGEWVPSRAKQIMWGAIGLMALPVLMWGLGNLGGPKAKPAQVAQTQAAQTNQSVQPPAAAAPQAPESTADEPAPMSASSGSGSPGQNSPPAPETQQTGEAIPSPPTPAVGGEVPPPPQTTGYTASSASGGAYMAAGPQELAGPPLTVYTAVPGQGQAPPQTASLQAYARPAVQAQGEGAQPTGMALPVQTQAAQAPTMTAFRSEGGREVGQVPPVASFVAYRASPSTPPPSPAPPPGQPSGGELRYFAQGLPEVFGQDQPAAPSPAPSAPPSRPAPNTPSTAPVSQTPYLPGTRIPGRLAVKLVVPEGEEVPVAVEAQDGSVFLGKAKLSPTRRVELSLDQVVLAGRTFSLRAVALGGDMAQGLPAQVREEAPSLVADLVRGSLRGLSDYVRARSQQTTITTTPGGGTVVQQGQTPPLELFLGAAAADLFAVPQGTRAVVRVAEVAEGTPLTVLVLGQ